ncbi:MAG: hypothetical protein KDA21_10410, partial [Phycisphaerales bacterium]|nr:hypothetical protein [Phycisphaerales bacterium]
KHVPWIHNVRHTDMVCAIDDRRCLQLVRLFNEPAGREALVAHGVPAALVGQLDTLGISCICNLLASIKAAKYYGMGRDDVIVTVLTDSMALYGSRLEELRQEHGAYTERSAWRDIGRGLDAVTTDHLRELSHRDRRALHHLKYFTWVEQQQRSVADLERLWDPAFWGETYAQVETWDGWIRAFNDRVAAMGSGA